MFCGTRKVAHSGGDDEVGQFDPDPFEHPGQHALGPPVSVDIRIVKMIDSRIQAARMARSILSSSTSAQP